LTINENRVILKIKVKQHFQITNLSLFFNMDNNYNDNHTTLFMNNNSNIL